MKHLWGAISLDAPIVPPRRLGTALMAAGLLGGSAVLAIAIAYPALNSLAFSLSAPALVASALIGGATAGILVTVVAVAAGLTFQLLTGEPEHLVVSRLSVSLLNAAVIMFIGEAYYRGRRRTLISEAELRSREAHLQTILEAVPEGMFVFDESGKILSFNKRSEEIFGVSAQEALGTSAARFFPDDLNPSNGLQPGFRIPSGETRVFPELRARRTDGTIIPVRLSVGGLQIGNHRYYTAFGLDLSPLRDAEARQSELRSQLTHVWRMNTIGEMAGVLSHELNQPLGAISNYLAAAKVMAVSKPVQETKLISTMERAAAQAVRAGEIIRRLRRFVERNDADQKPDSVADLIGEIEPMIQLVARERSVEVQYRLDNDLPLVQVDRIQIQQVLLNLVRNSIEAMSSSDKRLLEIEAARRGDGICIAVSDSGPGIAPEVAQRLFEPFSSTKQSGMGVGLSISRAIVETHEGMIAASASKWGGARIEFTLKCAAGLS